jgi:hypothetical protein
MMKINPSNPAIPVAMETQLITLDERLLVVMELLID